VIAVSSVPMVMSSVHQNRKKTIVSINNFGLKKKQKMKKGYHGTKEH